jgi:hypothetical protein
MNDISSKALPGLRLAIGIGAWTAPGLTGKLFGFDLSSDQQSTYFGRLFAIRDVALGIGALTTTGETRRLWWQLGVLCDVADAAAGMLGVRGGIPKRAGVPATLVAVGAAGMGIAALAAQKD